MNYDFIRKPLGHVNVRDALSVSERANLVRRLVEVFTSPDEHSYIFKHALVQETVYGSLTRHERARLHQLIAQELETSYPDRLDENAALLVQHFSAANDDHKTLEYATRAGDEAARHYANQEARSFYARAIETGIQTGASSIRLAHLYSALGRVLELSGQYEQALENYQAMQALAQERGAPAMELGALISLGTLRAHSTPVHNPEQAQLLSERALVLARQLGDRPAEAKVYWNLMLMSKFIGNTRQAVAYGEKSLDIARAYDPATDEGQQLREQLAFTLNDIALHGYRENGQFDLALATMEQARQLWRELNNQPMLGDSFGGTSLIYATRGDFAEALAAADEARRIGEKIGNLWVQSYSRWVVGDIYWEYGEITRAIETMEACMQLGYQAGFVATLVGIQSNLGLLYGEMGDAARGVEYARRALDTAEQELAGWLRWPLSALARLFVRQGEPAQAQAMLDRAAGTSSEGYFTIRVESVVAMCELALARRETAQVISTAETELERQFEAGARVYRADLLLLKANALLQERDLLRGKETLEQARAEAEAIGSRRMLWRILNALSGVEKELGNQASADALQRQAQELAQFIADSAPPDLRARFLSLPDVRALEVN